jgi:hypothetical protein
MVVTHHLQDLPPLAVVAAAAVVVMAFQVGLVVAALTVQMEELVLLVRVLTPARAMDIPETVVLVVLVVLA